MAGRTRAPRLPDEPGGRRHLDHAVPDGPAGNDLGGGGCVAGLDEKYGVPRALYTDWKNVYVREPTAQELLHGRPAVTQFGRMCERLGIKIIAAGSPEA